MVPMCTIGMGGPHVYNRDGLSVADPGGGGGTGFCPPPPPNRN